MNSAQIAAWLFRLLAVVIFGAFAATVYAIIRALEAGDLVDVSVGAIGAIINLYCIRVCGQAVAEFEAKA